mmetsp:Transcript_27337/g.76328  ORF Transcript_27337/g.76328 Transcript_27337/m.76328 type:complete len:430 (+) Transcript_27337:1477-2766(+)
MLAGGRVAVVELGVRQSKLGGERPIPRAALACRRHLGPGESAGPSSRALEPNDVSKVLVHQLPHPRQVGIAGHLLEPVVLVRVPRGVVPQPGVHGGELGGPARKPLEHRLLAVLAAINLAELPSRQATGHPALQQQCAHLEHAHALRPEGHPVAGQQREVGLGVQGPDVGLGLLGERHVGLAPVNPLELDVFERRGKRVAVVDRGEVPLPGHLVPLGEHVGAVAVRVAQPHVENGDLVHLMGFERGDTHLLAVAVARHKALQAALLPRNVGGVHLRPPAAVGDPQRHHRRGRYAGEAAVVEEVRRSFPPRALAHQRAPPETLLAAAHAVQALGVVARAGLFVGGLEHGHLGPVGAQQEVGPARPRGCQRRGPAVLQAELGFQEGVGEAELRVVVRARAAAPVLRLGRQRHDLQVLFRAAAQAQLALAEE